MAKAPLRPSGDPPRPWIVPLLALILAAGASPVPISAPDLLEGPECGAGVRGVGEKRGRFVQLPVRVHEPELARGGRRAGRRGQHVLAGPRRPRAADPLPAATKPVRVQGPGPRRLGREGVGVDADEPGRHRAGVRVTPPRLHRRQHGDHVRNRRARRGVEHARDAFEPAPRDHARGRAHPGGDRWPTGHGERRRRG